MQEATRFMDLLSTNGDDIGGSAMTCLVFLVALQHE